MKAHVYITGDTLVLHFYLKSGLLIVCSKKDPRDTVASFHEYPDIYRRPEGCMQVEIDDKTARVWESYVKAKAALKQSGQTFIQQRNKILSLLNP